MKKRLIKPLCLLLIIVTVLSSFIVTVSAADTKTVTSGDFVFSVKDKTATLIEYKGNASSVTVPSKVKGAKVKAVGDYAFWQKKNMKSVSLPKTVKTIGEAAFNECTSLKEVKMPDSLTTVKSAAFWYCTNLESVLMNKKAATFGENVFKGCKKLTVYVYEGSKAEAFAKKQDGVKTGYYFADKITASKSISCNLSKTVKLKVSTVPENVYGVTYTYKTSDKTVATVSSKGVVKGVKPGKAVITVTTKKTENGKAKSVKIKVSVKPQTATDLKVSDKTPTSYKLTWKNPNTAKLIYKYSIYEKNASGKWVKLADTDKTYYTVKNLKLGSSKAYRVKVLVNQGKENYYSSNSKTVTAATLKPANVSGLKATATTVDSVSLSWTKVPSASGYRIYSYNASQKKYTYVANTTSDKYTFKNLKANTCYAYAVKAYFEKDKDLLFSGKYSNLLYTYTTPTAVTGLKEMDNSAAVDSVTVSWNALQNVTGYELSYCEAGTNKWKSVSVANNLCAYKVSKIEGVTEYDFRIRAVRKVGNISYKGPYSQVITVTVQAVPEDNNQALEAFATALNNAESYTPAFNLFVNKTVSELKEETLDPRVQNVISDIENSVSFAQYSFADGKDTVKGLTLKEVMAPDRGDNAFSKDLVDTEKLQYRVDGSGYSMSFYVNDKNGTMFTPEIDFAALAEKHGFTLGNVTYETYIDQTKIQSDRFDMMKVNVTFSADIIYGDETFNLTGTVSHLYLFSW